VTEAEVFVQNRNYYYKYALFHFKFDSNTRALAHSLAVPLRSHSLTNPLTGLKAEYGVTQAGKPGLSHPQEIP